MLNNVVRGVIAGAAGTIALDAATYADMTLRGRPPSTVPAKMAGILADKVGLSLSGDSAGGDDEKAQNRQSGLGALFGYMTGLGVGVAYGLLRVGMDAPSNPLAGIGTGLAAMAASDIPIAMSGVSDPKTWSTADWASDVIPHLIYGLVTVATYEAVSC